MDKFLVTDANGKEFQFSIDELTDMNSDVFSREVHNLSDSDKLKSSEVDIVDSDGNAIDFATFTDSEVASIKAIDVTYEATHSGDNRNYAIYHSDSMEKDAASWMSPYPKPFIKNHDISSEPMGRVTDFFFGQSEFNQDRDTINVTWRITDKDAIPKFLDKRYSTMSIGAKVGHIKCNICGKDILKDGKVKFCGHWKGETYGTQKALWHARDLEYREGSVVNSPADDWAQVKKIVVLKEDDGKSNSNDNIDDDNSILQNMDNLISDAEGTDFSVDNKDDDVTEGDNTDDTQVNDGEEGNLEDTSVSDESNVDALKEQLKVKDSLITELESKLNDSESKVNELSFTIDSLNNEISALNDKETKLNSELSNMTDQSVKLAVMNKRLMTDKIVDLEFASKDIEDKEERRKELMKLSSVELKDKYDGLDVNDVVQRTITSISNPSLVNTTDGNSILENEGDDAVVETTKVSIKDMEERLVANILR